MAKKNKKKKPETTKSKSPIKKIGLFAISIIMIVFFKAAFLLLLIAMLPSIIANYTDYSAEKIKVSTIACCNLSGAISYIVPYAYQGGEWEHFTHYFQNIQMWLIIYGMAACGYGLNKFCPIIYHTFLRLKYISKTMKIEQQHEKLKKEWGSDIAVVAAQNSNMIGR